MNQALYAHMNNKRKMKKKISIIRNYCISCPKGQLSTPVGDLTCLGLRLYNDTAQKIQWWGTPNHTKPQPHPLANFCAL
jgi:hypothetical protein